MIGGYSSCAQVSELYDLATLKGEFQFTENSSKTYGPFSDMLRSLVDLNLSLGSAIIALFFLLTVAEGLDLSLEKDSEIPVGNCRAGRRHALASALDSEVLYYIVVSVANSGSSAGRQLTNGIWRFFAGAE